MCEYCEKEKDYFFNSINKSVFINHGKLIVEQYAGSLFRTLNNRVEIDIDYCPMCGRKLV